MSEFLIDTNEPHEILPPLVQTITHAQLFPLNVNGYADYRWTKVDGTMRQVERKTWGEILANPDKVEEQLQRHLTKNEDIDLVFMLEGMAIQTEMGVYGLKPTNNGRMFVPGHRYSTRLARVYSLLFALTDYCTVFQTSGLNESATLLVSMYNHDQKTDHHTLKRHIKQVDFNPDSRITTLMGATPGLGDKRATSLINAFGTPWNIWSAGFKQQPVIQDLSMLTQVDGIGNGIVTNIMRSIGRPDV